MGNARTDIQFTIKDNPDFLGDGFARAFRHDDTPAEGAAQVYTCGVLATGSTGGTVVDLGNLDCPVTVGVTNLDTTNYIEVVGVRLRGSWQPAAQNTMVIIDGLGGAVSNNSVVGDPNGLQDFSLTPAFAERGEWMRYSGSGVGNDGVYLIRQLLQSAGAGTPYDRIELAYPSTTDAAGLFGGAADPGNDDPGGAAVRLEFFTVFCLYAAPGESVLVHDVWPEFDLRVFADTAAVSTFVAAWGL